MMAIEEALKYVHQHLEQNEIEYDRTLWILTDSQSAITYLRGGPNAPLTAVGDNIWKLMKDIQSHGTSINYQWVPGHRDIAGNEEADKAAGEANMLPQNEVPIDFATIKAALTRKAWDEWNSSDEPKSTFSHKITSGRSKSTANLSREDEVSSGRERVHSQESASPATKARVRNMPSA